MSEKTTPGASGQATDPSTNADDNEDVLDFLVGLHEYLDENMPRIRAACDRFDARIKAQRALEDAEDKDQGDDEAPDTEPEPPHTPGLARLSNGRMAISIVHLEGVNLEGRQRWEGIILSEAEACDALDRLSDAADEAAGHVAGRILQNSKKRRQEEDDDGDE